jgi:hypothetical protein
MMRRKRLILHGLNSLSVSEEESSDAATLVCVRRNGFLEKFLVSVVC